MSATLHYGTLEYFGSLLQMKFIYWMDDNFRHYANIGNNIGHKMYIIFSLIIDSNVENMNIVIGNMNNMNNVLHPDYPYYSWLFTAGARGEVRIAKNVSIHNISLPIFYWFSDFLHLKISSQKSVYNISILKIFSPKTISPDFHCNHSMVWGGDSNFDIWLTEIKILL